MAAKTEKIMLKPMLPGYLGEITRATLISQFDRCLKRGIDLVLSLLALLVMVPLVFVIGIIIRFDSRGPIFYKTLRVGRNQQHFYMYKFRTMHPDAEKMLQTNLALKQQFEQNYKLERDWRVTRAGGILRRTGLDELPQLVNIIKGDMSLVGPRPLLIEEMKQLLAKERFAVRPGLTGLWQVKGKNAVSYLQKNKFDRFYATHRTVLMDLQIVINTIPAIIKGKGF